MAPPLLGRGEKTPKTPKISALLRKRPVLLSGPISSLLRTENGLTTDIFVVNYTGRGLVVKRPGVLSKVQMLNLVLGVGVFSLLPNFACYLRGKAQKRAGGGVSHRIGHVDAPRRLRLFFCLQLEASCLQLSFCAYSCVVELFSYSLVFY